MVTTVPSLPAELVPMVTPLVVIDPGTPVSQFAGFDQRVLPPAPVQFWAKAESPQTVKQAAKVAENIVLRGMIRPASSIQAGSSNTTKPRRVVLIASIERDEGKDVFIGKIECLLVNAVPLYMRFFVPKPDKNVFNS